MNLIRTKWSVATLGLSATLLLAGAAQASLISDTYEFAVNTTSLTGQSGYLDFEFDPGVTPFDSGSATLAGFTYLDRVDLLAPPGQGLLLGVLKALQDRPSGRAILLASSEASLRQMAGQGLILPDLAFRLTAIRFAVPPLRMRREDISPLAQALLDHLCARYQQNPVVLGPGALARLLQHNWPGNVRELAGVLETALLEAVNGVIRPADLAIPDPCSIQPDPLAAPPPGNLALDAVIRHHVQYVLDLNRGNKLRAARQLDISRSTLYRILANESLLAR